ncbi:unnamed protein product [Rotaria sp. Silwood2]|nr:unnamed protein product [Rotaria sp. Silwood2]
MVEARLGRTVMYQTRQAVTSYMTAATLAKQKSIQQANDHPVFVTPETNSPITVHYGRHLTSGLLTLYDLIINNKQTKIITSASSKLVDRLAENYGVQFFLTMCETLASTDIRPVANGLAGDAATSSNDLRLVDLALSHTAGTRERHYERAQRPGDSKHVLGLFA